MRTKCHLTNKLVIFVDCALVFFIEKIGLTQMELCIVTNVCMFSPQKDVLEMLLSAVIFPFLQQSHGLLISLINIILAEINLIFGTAG